MMCTYDSLSLTETCVIGVSFVSARVCARVATRVDAPKTCSSRSLPEADRPTDRQADRRGDRQTGPDVTALGWGSV